MEFFGALAPFAEDMLNGITESAMASAHAFNSSLVYNTAQNNISSQQFMQRSAQDFVGEQAQNFQNFQSQLSAQNSQQQLGIQSARFQSLNDLQNARLSVAQQMQSQQIGSSFARGALNFGSGLVGGAIQAGLQSQAASLQRENFDYMTSKASDAYTSAGLPSWLAFQNNISPQSMASQLPRTSQVITGQNMMTSELPGNPMSTPWTGSDSQSAFGFGDAPTAS